MAVRHHLLQAASYKQNANEGCNSCAILAGLLACFIIVVMGFEQSYS